MSSLGKQEVKKVRSLFSFQKVGCSLEVPELDKPLGIFRLRYIIFFLKELVNKGRNEKQGLTFDKGYRFRTIHSSRPRIEKSFFITISNPLKQLPAIIKSYPRLLYLNMFQKLKQ